MNIYLDLFLTFSKVGVCLPNVPLARRGPLSILFAGHGSESRAPSRQWPRPAVRGPGAHADTVGGF